MTDSLPSGAAYYNASIQHTYENGEWTQLQTNTYYDAAGNVIQTTYPDGSFTQTLYSLYGQPISSTTLASVGITDAPSFTLPAGGQEVVKIDQRKAGDPAVATFNLYDRAGNLTDVYQPAVTVPYGGVVANDQPAGYWRLGESSGSTASDSTPNGNNGTYTGVTLGQSGALSGDSDTAASFNGSSSNVSVPDSSSLEISSQLSLECWINYSMPNGGTGAPGIITKDDGYIVRGYGLYAAYAANQHLEFAVNIGGAQKVLTTSGSYNDAHWHYVVATYDGSTMRIYVDGSLVASMAASGAIESNADPLMIGTFDQANADSHFDGSIDEAAVYDSALSASQVAAHYNAALATMVRPHWQYTYDSNGNQLTQVDPKGNTTSFTYDALGGQLSRTLPDGQTGMPLAGQQTETFTYDAHGRTVTHTDFDGHMTFYVYDDSSAHGGREVAEYRYGISFVVPAGFDPDTPGSLPAYQEKTVTIYDDDPSLPVAEQLHQGRVSEVDDYAIVNGAMSLVAHTHYTYDPITGNETSVASDAGTINYAYDPSTGQHIEISTADTDTKYAYDTQGRLTTVTVTKANGQTLTTPLVTSYAYDPLGNLQTETLPDGTVTTYGHDSDNRLTDESTKDASNNIQATYHYTIGDNGQRSSELDHVKLPAGTFSDTLISWKYDADGRLGAETYDAGNNGISGSGGTPDGDWIDYYTYDLVGNRITKVHDVNGDGIATADDIVSTFSYRLPGGGGQLAQEDGNDRLIEERDTTGGSSPTTTTTLYGHFDSGGVFHPGYDANGFVTETHVTGGTTADDTYTPDLRGRMKSATVNGQTVTYTCDTDGNIIGKTTGSNTTYSLPDKNNPSGYVYTLEQSSSQAGSPTITYILGDSGVLAQIDGATGAVSYLLVDGHGSTRQLIDGASGAIQSYYAYDAFGNQLSSSVLGSITTQYLYTGQQWDAGISQYDLRARFYEPGIGRFSSFDSDSISLHKYLYGDADPIDATDLSGNFPDFTLGSLSDLLGGLDFGYASALFASAIGGALAAQINPAIGFTYTTSSQVEVDLVDEQWAEMRAFLFGFAQGAVQGVLNAVNGLQDVAVGLLNSGIEASPIGLAAEAAGFDPTISSPDWSQGLVYNEPAGEHAASKFLGGNGVFIVLTAGVGAVIGGSRGGLTLRNLLAPSEQAEFEALQAKYPGWMPEEGLDTRATVRSVEENAEARSQFRGSGHHPQPLKFGGDPNPPDLVTTGETRTFKNPIHTEITNFWNRVLRRINSK